jgi:hypothetical protein
MLSGKYEDQITDEEGTRAYIRRQGKDDVEIRFWEVDAS